MLLNFWPLFIALPEAANYALRDQQKRDEQRLAARRKQVAEELEARRTNAGPENTIELMPITSAINAGTQSMQQNQVIIQQSKNRQNEEDLFLLLAVL